MTDGRDPLLSIGTFARRSRLSVKALRLYDRSGLLVPADVSPGSGYRRYRESQLPRARLIVLMRRAGIPLARVAEIIAAPGPAGADLLADYWADAETQFERRRELVRRLRASLLSGDTAGPDVPYGIRQRDVPAQFVLTEKRSLQVTELKKWLPDVMCRLAEAASRHGGLAGDMYAVYYGEVNEDSDGPVEVCAPVGARIGEARDEPARREAYVAISRAQLEFPQILSAYDAVADWIGSAGLTQAGPPREVYPRGIDIATAAPGDLVCQIAFPVDPDGAILRLFRAPWVVSGEWKPALNCKARCSIRTVSRSSWPKWRGSPATRLARVSTAA